MSRRILSVVMAALGLVLVVLAVCSAAIWKPDSRVETKLASSPSQPYVITVPEVLSGMESDAAMTASSSDDKGVHLFVARAANLGAWMSPDANKALPYAVVTSINTDTGNPASRDETRYCPSVNVAPVLSTTPSAQPSAPVQADDSQCSARKATGVTASSPDIWLGGKTGGSSVIFDIDKGADHAMLPHKSLDEQIVVMTMTNDKASTPGLAISQKHQVETSRCFYGGLALGSLFVLVGAFLFFIDLQLYHANIDRHTRSTKRTARVANANSVSTESIPQVDDPDRRLSRRGLRDKERAEVSGEPWTDPRTGRICLDGAEASSASRVPEILSTDGYGYDPAVRPSTDSDSGSDDGADTAYGEGHGGQGERTVVGVVRDTSIIPRLDEVATQQHRAAREPEDLLGGEALAIILDTAQISGPSASFSSATLSGTASTSVGDGHIAASMDQVTEQPADAPGHSCFAPLKYHTGHVAGDNSTQTFKTGTAEFQNAAPSVPLQEPGLQMLTGLARPEVSDAPLNWSEQEIESTHGPTFSPSSFEDFPAASTAVSQPSYSDGVELPPQADPAVIQVADAEPLSEPDLIADPDNQERT